MVLGGFVGGSFLVILWWFCFGVRFFLIFGSEGFCCFFLLFRF